MKNNVMPNLTNAINQIINQQLNKQVETAISKVFLCKKKLNNITII